MALYAACLSNPVEAAVLCSLRRGFVGYRGLWLDKEFPGRGTAPKPDWDTLSCRWRRQLRALAEDFMAGRGWLTHGNPRALRGFAALLRLYDPSPVGDGD